jgi:hypothetical protein
MSTAYFVAAGPLFATRRRDILLGSAESVKPVFCLFFLCSIVLLIGQGRRQITGSGCHCQQILFVKAKKIEYQKEEARHRPISE